MTPEHARHYRQILIEAFKGWRTWLLEHGWLRLSRPPVVLPPDSVINEALGRIIAQAIEHEREECAKLAEGEPRVWDASAPDPQHRIAARIRARGQEK